MTGPATGDGSVGAEREHEGSRPSVDGEDWTGASEAQGRRPPDWETEAGAVHENSAVDEVEAPAAGAGENAGHGGSCLCRLLAGRGKNRGEHLAEGSEERVASA